MHASVLDVGHADVLGARTRRDDGDRLAHQVVAGEALDHGRDLLADPGVDGQLVELAQPLVDLLRDLARFAVAVGDRDAVHAVLEP